MTPADLFEFVDVYRRRQKQEMWRTAWLASRIMACFTEKPPTVDELLGDVTDA